MVRFFKKLSLRFYLILGLPSRRTNLRSQGLLFKSGKISIVHAEKVKYRNLHSSMKGRVRNVEIELAASL